MDNHYFLPEDVTFLCNRLRQAGYPAYAVGGGVRDLVLGHSPNDWDIATSAHPEQIITVFGASSNPTGLSHGTVTVNTGVRPVEVTTFRLEGPYSDFRRPDWVKFVDNLHIDLARRDFTINAMAFDELGRMIDPFGGMSDLSKGIIHTVGAPMKRFHEDRLRLYRAVRFSAQLNFSLGIPEMKVLFSHPEWGLPVSVERIRMELEKGLCTRNPERLAILFSSGLLNRFLDNSIVPNLAGLSSLEALPSQRWAGLCSALLACGAIIDPQIFLRRFHMDRRTMFGALELINL